MDPIWTQHLSLLLTFYWPSHMVTSNYSSSPTSVNVAIYFRKWHKIPQYSFPSSHFVPGMR